MEIPDAYPLPSTAPTHAYFFLEAFEMMFTWCPMQRIHCHPEERPRNWGFSYLQFSRRGTKRRTERAESQEVRERNKMLANVRPNFQLTLLDLQFLDCFAHLIFSALFSRPKSHWRSKSPSALSNTWYIVWPLHPQRYELFIYTWLSQ